MNAKFPLSADAPELSIEREESASPVELGRWVRVATVERRVNRETQEYEDHPFEYLGCITGIGSNYIEVSRPTDGGKWSSRIHNDEVWECCTFLTDTEAHAGIQERIQGHQQESNRLMSEIQEVTLRLGLRTEGALPDNSPHTEGTALVTLSAQPDMDAYKTALVVAKEKTLPKLFEELKENNRRLTIWLTASTLPLLARAGDMKGYVSQIQDRIFNVSLYAGLVEEVVQVKEGAPADLMEKLHVMQRRCYMDEECLANYEAGGMSFSEIGQFDAWLSKSENFDRILPKPRCMVAFQVRRRVKDREWDGTLHGAFINIRLGELDKATFLYIRNGEQLWRLQSEIDFGHLIFPDKAVYDPSEPMMIKKGFASEKPEQLVTKRYYDDLVAEVASNKAKHEAWIAEHGEYDDSGFYHSPFRNFEDYSNRLSMYEPFDSTSLYYDDALKLVEEEIKQYNRIALIIQGLFDRSQVLHPHLPVQTWTPEGFAKAITLVFDGAMVLHDGEAPDFEAYRAECNASITEGSMVTGQYEFWRRQEAEKEMKRRRSDYRLSEAERYQEVRYYTPYGNEGPEVVAPVGKWTPKSRMATFTWERKRLSGDYFERKNKTVTCKLQVPDSELFNVSAYRPGDFKRFYQDGRTRAQYLKWAPLLLAAEDWWAKR